MKIKEPIRKAVSVKIEDSADSIYDKASRQIVLLDTTVDEVHDIVKKLIEEHCED